MPNKPKVKRNLTLQFHELTKRSSISVGIIVDGAPEDLEEKVKKEMLNSFDRIQAIDHD